MGDFDEYEYLEKAVESTEAANGAAAGGAAAGGGGGGGKEEAMEERRSSKRHGDEGGERSKRSRGEDKERDRDKERDKERHRDKDGGDREKSKDRDRDKEREGRRDKGKDDDLHRSHERDKDRDKDKDKDKERERERTRDRDRDRGEREKPRGSEERPKKRDKTADAEPEADPERDQRTVFAYQINLKADERDVYEFFSRAGKVRDVRLIMDRNSRRSKGVGYVEFYDAMSVPMAIALSGQLLLGTPVMVKPSEAEKNLVQAQPVMPFGMPGLMGMAMPAGGIPGLNTTGPYTGGARRLYVGNLHFNMTEEQLRQVFEPFGPVEMVQLPMDPETNQCKGFGFVQYTRLEDARAAQANLNGLELAGRAIKVSPVSEQVGNAQEAVQAGELDDDEGGGLSLNARSRALLMQKLDRSNAAGSVAASTPSPPIPGLGILGGAAGVGASPLAPGLAAGALGALSGVGAMSGMGTPPVGIVPPGMVGMPPGESMGVPSEYLLLKNMFDPSTETEPDFEMDIKDDVLDEVSKYGAIKHIFVDKWVLSQVGVIFRFRDSRSSSVNKHCRGQWLLGWLSSNILWNSAGHVYLRFDSATASIAAQRALQGRWFAGKMITATFQTALSYMTKFPDA
eukprot:SM000056S17965  [mRNA]  locus=s56:323425:328468:- [translate_table: standard]